MSRPPTHLGGFALARELGQGGMGSVWLATRGEGTYALKVIPSSSDEETRERFRREGEAMARVRAHPHLTQVHTLVEDQGWLALALEYCPGGDLEDRLRLGPLEPEAARSLLDALASGLEVAHAAGVLHRDLKPANVIFDEAQRPKLTDFGLAKLHDRQSLTQTGALLGTPSYMAPEQATTGDCDVRTDVYGLGGILYHCLSGGPPFQGGSVLAVLEQVLQSPPPPLPSEVPAALREACLRALAKDPDERFPDVTAFRAALRAEVTAAPGPGRGLLLGAALFACCVAGGALLHAALRRPRPTATPTASQPTAPPPPASAAPTPARRAEFPGLLPWPRQAPQRGTQRQEALRLLQTLADRDRLFFPAVYARLHPWEVQTPERLVNVAPTHPPRVRPSMLLRAFERGAISLGGLGPHFAGQHPEDGFEGDPLELELLLLGLLRNGDHEARALLRAHYEAQNRPALRRHAERAQRDVLDWRALGARTQELLETERPPLGPLPELARPQARPFLTAAWAQLAPLSPETLETSFSLPPPELEPASDLELRASGMSTLGGGDEGLLVSATCLGSIHAARGLIQQLLAGSPREQRVARALAAMTYLAADAPARAELSQGDDLYRAGLQPRPAAPLDAAALRIGIRRALREGGLLGPPAPSAELAPLQVAPPKRDAGLDVRAQLEELFLASPLLRSLWREAYLTRASKSGSPQARELRDALGPKGISALKKLSKSLADPKAQYFDPVLATRLALRLVQGGFRGTSMIVYKHVAEHDLGPKEPLLSATLGVSALLDDVAQAKSAALTSAYELEVPELAPAWETLRAFDAALATRPLRRASERTGPPGPIPVAALFTAAGGTYVPLRWLQRASQAPYAGPLVTKTLARAKVTRRLVAGYRRGALEALPALFESHDRLESNAFLRFALVHFALSAEEGPIAERAGWKIALEVLPTMGRGAYAKLLEALLAEPERADLWRAFYLQRERTFMRLGLPSHPELGAWGTPRELLGE